MKIKRPLLLFAEGIVLGEVFVLWRVAFTGYLAFLLCLGVWFWYAEGRSFRRLFPFALLFCAALGVGAGRMNAVKQAPLPAEVWKELDGRTVSLEGEIREISVSDDVYCLTMKDNRIKIGEKVITLLPLLSYLEDCDEKALKIGRRVRLQGRIEEFSTSRNPGEFDYALYYRSRKLYYRFSAKKLEILDAGYSPYREGIRRLRTHLSRIFTLTTGGSDTGVYQAALLGDKGGLDEEIRKLYQVNGIAHLLAISGLHVSLIGMSLYRLLCRFGLRRGKAGAAGGFLIFSYGIMTGASSSVVRAVIMLLCLLLAEYLGRTYDLLSAASLAAILLLLDSPLLITQGGFLLSFGAVLGIGCLNGGLTEWLHPRRSLEKALLVSLSVQLMTYPVILYSFYEFPVYGILLNLLVIPLMAVVIGSGIAAACVGSVWILAGTACAGPGHYVLKFYEFLCMEAGKLPESRLILGRPHVWQLSAYFLILSFLFFVLKRNITAGGPENKQTKEPGIKNLAGRWAVLMFFCTVLFLMLFPMPPRGLFVTFLDVGQGDGIVIRSGKGCILVDGGSSSEKKLGQYRLEPFLKSQGVSQIDYAIVSHGDLDHISGLTYLLEQDTGIHISALVLPCLSEKDAEYERLRELAADRGTRVYLIKAGDKFSLGAIEIDCLYPGPDDPAGDKNEHSEVLRVTYGAFQMLLTGDMSQDGERRLLASLEKKPGALEDLKQVQVLKAAHHGSKTSSCQEFLEAVMPEWFVISYGEGNSYGHPHKEVVERIHALSGKLWKTAQSGAVTLWTDGERVQWKPFLD